MSTAQSHKISSQKTVLASGGSSSQPDLSKIALEANPQVFKSIITTRKRKEPENDFACQLNVFKTEILNILKESSKHQNDNIGIISENTSAIREQLYEIKSTTEYLLAENNNLKLEMTNLKDVVKTNEEKITQLQNEIIHLKLQPQAIQPSEPSFVSAYDDVIAELQERVERSKNIVVVGIPEQHLENKEARQETDRSKLSQIIKTIYPDCPKEKRVLRLGKYDGKKIRPLKVLFASEDTAKIILRNQVNLKLDGVRIYSDQTPKQQKQITNLKLELEKRLESGEDHLTIKYIKGTPKIIKRETKN